MRFLLPILLAALALASCQCQPGSPTPVTFRIKNPLGTPIFVNASDGRMGLHVKRHVLGDWIEVDAPLKCECRSCDRICGGCACEPKNEARVAKIAAGGSLERTWDGVMQISSRAACAGALVPGPECLSAENPALNEKLLLELCFALSAPGAEDADAGVTVPGALPPASTQCVQKEFKVEDGVVEISPRRGSSCTTHADCTGAGELCFSGTCTTVCPANGFPELGSSWQVHVNEPTDNGVFTTTQSANAITYEGTGTVGSVRYDNNTMRLQLKRPIPNTDKSYTASVDVVLPAGIAVPLVAGESISVKIVDATNDQVSGNRAITLRDPEGALLLAADSALNGRVLKDSDLAPFSLQRGAEAVGCRDTDCGKNLFFRMRFAAGTEAVELEPGKSADMIAVGQSWRVVNVSASEYASDSWCQLTQMVPYVIVNLRTGP